MATNWEFSKLTLKQKLSFGLIVFLTGIFILPLGATQCTDPGPSGQRDANGGTVAVAPGETIEVSDDEFEQRLFVFRRIAGALGGPSLSYQNWFRFDRAGRRSQNDVHDAWGHTALLEAARTTGYTAGPREVNSHVREVVRSVTNQEFTSAAFERFLDKFFYGGTAKEFRAGLKEMAVKDKLVEPFIETSKFAISKPEAYELWKPSRERVDFDYWYVEGEAFGNLVELEERSRWKMGELQRTLTDSVQTASTVSSLWNKLEKVAAANEGAWPARLEDAMIDNKSILSGGIPKDVWSNELRYRLVDGKADLRSAGPDQEFDTADDIGPEVRAANNAHGALFRVAGLINNWRKAKEGTWPASLEDLTRPTAEGQVALMPKPIQDGWDQDLVYTAPEGEGAPTLASIGADGAAGTEDDLTITLDPDRVVVPPQGTLARFVDTSKQDAWGNAFQVSLLGLPASYGVRSAGADGEFYTDDDLDRGNRGQVSAYYLDRDVYEKYTLPQRRRFETLTMQLPLLPDSVLKKMWNDPKLAKFRPTNEEALFERWSSGAGGSLVYTSENPGDPTEGHGVEVVEAMGTEGVPYLVPGDGIFPDDVSTLAAGGDTPGEEGGEGQDEGGENEGGEAGEEDAEDTRRKSYREKGWRKVLIRQVFLENVMADLLRQINERRAEQARWDEKQEGERPEDITFETLLAGQLSPYLVGEADRNAGLRSFEYFKTDKLLDKSEIEALPHLKDPAFGVYIGQLSEPGTYGPMVRINKLSTIVLYRLIEFRGQENPKVDDPAIFEKVFAGYLERQRLVKASEELDALHKAAAQAEAGKTDEEKTKAFEEALAAFVDRTGVTPKQGSTGLFIGSRPPRPAPVTDGQDAATKAAVSVRNAVWANGYAATLPRTEGKDDVAPSVSIGDWGNRVLRDEATEEAEDHDGISRAILIRVRDRVYPPEEAFHAEEYQRYLEGTIYGRDPAGWQKPMGERKGAFWVALTRFYGDPNGIRNTFDIRTNSPW